MTKPTLYGTPISTFVRTTRILLAEKGVDYEHVDVGVLDGECRQEAHLKRNPFGKVPVLDHGDFRLYETNAIARYIDRAFEGPRFTPEDAKEQARMNQIMAIVDNHGYGAMIGGVVGYHFFPDFVGGQDDDRLAAAKKVVATVFSEYERIMGDGDYLAGGSEPTLADFYAAPTYFYISLTPEADDLIGPRGKLQDWWSRISGRESVTSTEPDLG